MSVEFIFRIIGMLIFALLGGYSGFICKRRNKLFLRLWSCGCIDRSDIDALSYKPSY